MTAAEEHPRFLGRLIDGTAVFGFSDPGLIAQLDAEIIELPPPDDDPGPPECDDEPEIVAARDKTIKQRAQRNGSTSRDEVLPAPPDEDGVKDLFVDGASFILDIPKTIPALWGVGNEVLWAEDESLMIAGPMGLGKTTLAGQLMRARLGLGGGLVLGMPVAPCDGRILYLAMDRPAQIARAFARQFDAADRDTLARRVLVWRGPPPADIARRPEILAYLAQQADADTVFLDSVKDAAIGLSDDEVGAGYNRARQILLAEHRQLAELHHTTKRGANGGPPTTVADIYGSAWITNGTGSIILLSGDPGDPIVGFHHLRPPADQVGPFRLIHDQTAGHLSIEHQTDLVELVKAKGADGLTARDAAAVLFDEPKPSRSSKEKARRKLDKLAAQGLLVRHTSGDVTAYFLAARQ